jgi:hypothetical protein
VVVVLDETNACIDNLSEVVDGSTLGLAYHPMNHVDIVDNIHQQV